MVGRAEQIDLPAPRPRSGAAGRRAACAGSPQHGPPPRVGRTGASPARPRSTAARPTAIVAVSRSGRSGASSGTAASSRRSASIGGSRIACGSSGSDVVEDADAHGSQGRGAATAPTGSPGRSRATARRSAIPRCVARRCPAAGGRAGPAGRPPVDLAEHRLGGDHAFQSAVESPCAGSLFYRLTGAKAAQTLACVNLDQVNQYERPADRRRGTDRTTWLPAEAALDRLGVARQTLYAYVSRGLVRAAPGRGRSAPQPVRPAQHRQPAGTPSPRPGAPGGGSLDDRFRRTGAGVAHHPDCRRVDCCIAARTRSQLAAARDAGGGRGPAVGGASLPAVAVLGLRPGGAALTDRALPAPGRQPVRSGHLGARPGRAARRRRRAAPPHRRGCLQRPGRRRRARGDGRRLGDGCGRGRPDPPRPGAVRRPRAECLGLCGARGRLHRGGAAGLPVGGVGRVERAVAWRRDRASGRAARRARDAEGRAHRARRPTGPR